MSKKDFHKTYRQFVVYPFRDKGAVERLDGKAHEFVDSNGYRMIKSPDGTKRPVSHIIYAVGISVMNRGYCFSFRHMANHTVSYKNGDKSDCHFSNLVCKPKKEYVKLLKHQYELSKYWK